MKLARSFIRTNPRQHFRRAFGVTLVELMITVAVLSVIAAIAIPAYRGYVKEGHFTAIRTTITGMRTSIEDYRLENGDYGATGNLAGIAAINGRFGWQPSGDTGAYSYTLAVVSTNNYDVWGTYGSSVWVRCENRFGRCCDSDATGATTPSSSCP